MTATRAWRDSPTWDKAEAVGASFESRWRHGSLDSACAESDLIWLESPSNPMLAVAELVAICAAPRKRGAILGVDNTFATPLNQRPLLLGADVAVQSVTKFIGGHSDLLGGVVTVRDSALLAALPGKGIDRRDTRHAGDVSRRPRRANARRAAGTRAAERHGPVERLADHPEVLITRYPGLASHPTHEAACRQLKGFGTIISFDIRGGAEAADAVCTRLLLIQHATSLGAVSPPSSAARACRAGALPPSFCA